MKEKYSEIFIKLSALHWLLRRYHDKGIEDDGKLHNRSEGQGRVLALLKIRPEIPTKDIGYILGIKQQSLNELINRLESKGYVKREPDADDKRKMIVKLTERGRMIKQRELGFEEVFSDLDDHELEKFENILEKIIERLEKLSGDPIDEETYCKMEKISSDMGIERFREMISKCGFAGVPAGTGSGRRAISRLEEKMKEGK